MPSPNRFRIMLPRNLSGAGWALGEARDDVEIVPYSVDTPTAEIHAMLKDVHAIALGATPFGRAESEAAPLLRAVARIGVGFDAVDLAVLSERGLPLLTTGIANSPSVAEQAMYMMLMLAKRSREMDAVVREGRWFDRFDALPFDLIGRTLLIVGFGRIGSRLAKRALAFEMRVLVSDPYVDAAAVRAAGCEPVGDLDAALPEVDFLSLNCPKTKDTVGPIERRRLGLMKPTAFLVNTARGGIVDEPALYDALHGGRLAGAGLDVFAAEPPAKDNPLFTLPNVVLAPHMAGVTREAVDRMGITTVRNLLDALEGRPNPDNVVNKDVLAGFAAR